MKKLVYFLGILFLLLIVVLNILFSTRMDTWELVTISFNNPLYVLSFILLGIAIFALAYFIDKHLYNDINPEKKKKLRKILFGVAIGVYILFSLLWVIFVLPYNIGDNGAICDIATAFYRNDESMLDSINFYAGLPIRTYMQMYHQQIPLAFLFSIFLKMFNIARPEFIRGFNVMFNILSVISLYLITCHISKKYKNLTHLTGKACGCGTPEPCCFRNKPNKPLFLFLILAFVTLPMVATFIYGDWPALALCLLSVYFMMKYVETKTKKWSIFGAICSSFAFMFRMNSLIFVIATVIYLVLDFIHEFTKNERKENVIKGLIILLYIIITILPSSMIKTLYLKKYHLDPNIEYPNISYILMAMEEGPRANGWYKEERGEYALQHSDAAKDEYKEEIKERLQYFVKNPGYTFKFYIDKITSMWTENTYSAVRVNAIGPYEFLEDMTEPLLFYQKMLLVLTSVCTLVVLIQNRKNISLDIIFLLTIFIGGFLFHILWEAKSRYIIPYIVVLIPIASIQISKFKKK